MVSNIAQHNIVWCLVTIILRPDWSKHKLDVLAIVVWSVTILIILLTAVLPFLVQVAW